MFENLIEVLKKNPRRIVFTEGPDPRILEAASRLKAGGFLTPVLVGKADEVEAAAKAGGFDIAGLEILDPAAYPKMDEMVETMAELRKGKMTTEECRAALCKGNYFGTMLVKMGVADALLGGATYSTADTVRPALQIIKTKPGVTTASSCFVMEIPNRAYGQDGVMIFADCAVNIDPNAEQLAAIAIASAETAKSIAEIDEPKVAMMSFSTKGSGKGPMVDKVVEATRLVKELAPELNVDGELQADASLVEKVGQLKSPGSKVAGHANVLIFPSLEAGNIGYKLVQRLAGAEAIGPVMQGLARPVNDLSRGCSVEDIVSLCALTAVQAQAK